MRRKFEYEIPFGVLNFSNSSKIKSVIEKPKFNHMINAGVYALNPQVLKFIPKNTYFDITELVEILNKNNKTCNIFEIDDYWQDIGIPEVYNKLKGLSKILISN